MMLHLKYCQCVSNGDVVSQLNRSLPIGDNSWQFVGLESSNGFDQLLITIARSIQMELFAMDDLRFEGGECCVQMIRVLDTTDPVWTILPG